MKIITHTCQGCGTILAANVLETNREIKCPQVDCQELLRFSDLPKTDREHILENKERYQIKT